MKKSEIFPRMPFTVSDLSCPAGFATPGKTIIFPEKADTRFANHFTAAYFESYENVADTAGTVVKDELFFICRHHCTAAVSAAFFICPA